MLPAEDRALLYDRVPPPIPMPPPLPGDVGVIADLSALYRRCREHLNEAYGQIETGVERVNADWPSADPGVRQTLGSFADWYRNAERAYQLIWTTLGRTADELGELHPRMAGLREEVEALNRGRLRLIDLVTAAGGSAGAVPLELRPDVAAWIAERARVLEDVRSTREAAEASAQRTAEDLTLARAMTQEWRERILQHRLDVEAGRGDSVEPLWGLLAPTLPRAAVGLPPAAAAAAAVPAGAAPAAAASAAGLATALGLTGTVALLTMIPAHRRVPDPLTNTKDRALAVASALDTELGGPLRNADGEAVWTEPEPEPQPAAGGAGKFPRDPCGPDTPGWLKNLVRGNGFDHVNNDRYDHNQVVTADGKRLDSYRTTDAGGKELNGVDKEIISRKYTQLANQPYGAMRSLAEFDLKYAPGTELSTASALRTGDTELAGRKVLEVPPQYEPVPQRVLDEAEARRITIRDTNGLVYTTPSQVSTAPNPMAGYCP